jgi:hypothetical protein
VNEFIVAMDPPRDVELDQLGKYESRPSNLFVRSFKDEGHVLTNATRVTSATSDVARTPSQP